MRCRKHEWFPLMRTASSIDEMLTFAFGRYGDYMKCSHCGLIGYVIHSRRSGVRPLNTYGQERMQAQADEWNNATKRGKPQEDTN